MNTIPFYLAQATNYGEGDYGCGDYQTASAECVETTTTSSQGDLANTGTPVLVGGTVGVILVLAAIVLLVQGRKHRK